MNTKSALQARRAEEQAREAKNDTTWTVLPIAYRVIDGCLVAVMGNPQSCTFDQRSFDRMMKAECGGQYEVAGAVRKHRECDGIDKGARDE